MKGTLTKVSDNENKLRTSSIEGEFNTLPIVGQSFKLIGTPLDKIILKDGGFREITTSGVKEIIESDSDRVLFKTRNSLYRLDVTE